MEFTKEQIERISAFNEKHKGHTKEEILQDEDGVKEMLDIYLSVIF